MIETASPEAEMGSVEFISSAGQRFGTTSDR